jgi:hypothetical protein
MGQHQNFKMKKLLLLQLFLLSIVIGSCQQRSDEKSYDSDAFKKYWYAGNAEVNAYNLNQSRYGEPRSGKAVLIFVTEDFSKKKQVKLDDPSQGGKDKVSVLKLNFTKKFITGIYPYSMMQSVFTPVIREENPNTLKTTMSTQEWCGHVFTQMNLKDNGFDVKSFSYFEQEGDASFGLKKEIMEDELFNIIRLEPSALPTGEFELIPGLFFTRLNHVDLKSQPAMATSSERGSIVTYSISFPALERKLSIRFEKHFPHKILGWDEEFKERGAMQHTTATLDKTLIIDYWTKNKNRFEHLRDSLNLPLPY